MEENKFGYDEIVDTISDLIDAEVKAYEIFKDKFDIAKALTWAIGEYATIKEAFDDFAVFEAQMKDLFADEGMRAIEAIAQNLTEAQRNKSRLYKLALFSATGYRNTITIIELGREQLALGAAIFAK